MIEGLRKFIGKELQKFRVPLITKSVDDMIVSYTQKIKKGIVPPDKNKKIYLAHPYDRRHSKRKDMIVKKLKERGFKIVDPFTGENEIAKKYGVDDYYQNPCRDFALEIKERDFKAVSDCGALFAWIPKDVTMIGTIREYDKALEYGKYIIVLCYKPNPFLEDADELYLSYKDFNKGKKHDWT